ncbi:MAG: O-antigen ligase family protein [Anaerolineales bacterium]|nr:O-antigen ligase family protein [Anaerolineales bacterium]
MTVQRNDFYYLLSVVALSGLAAYALGNSNSNIQLYGLAGLMGIALVLAVIVKPNLGANVLIIAIYSNVSANMSDMGYPGIIKPLVAVVFSAIMIRNYYAGQLPVDRRNTAFTETFLILYFLVLAASYLVASNKDRALTDVVDLGKDLVILYTILFSVRTWKTWKQAVWMLTIVTFVLCLLGVYQIITGTRTQEFFRFSTIGVTSVVDSDNGTTARIGGPVHDPNLWAQVIVAVTPFLIFRIIHEAQLKWKVVAAGMLVPLLIVLLDTYSRGGYLAFIVILILVIFVFEIKRINPVGAVLTFAFLILLIPFLPSNYVARFDSLSLLTSSSQEGSGIYEDSSLRQRSSVMQTALLMFVQNPLLGVGAGNFRNNYQKYNQILGLEARYGEVEAHSLYTQIAAETGLLGLIAFIGIMISLFIALSKAVRSIEHLQKLRHYLPWLSALQASLVGYLVAATFLHNVYIRYFWILVALSMTAIQLVDEQVKEADQILIGKTS